MLREVLHRVEVHRHDVTEDAWMELHPEVTLTQVVQAGGGRHLNVKHGLIIVCGVEDQLQKKNMNVI